MLTKDLRIAPRANASLGATRAEYGASRGTRSPRGLSRAERTPLWRGGAALRPIPAGARAYARGATCARTGRGTRRRSGMARPGRQRRQQAGVYRGPGRSGVPAPRGARLQGTGGRCRLDTLTRRLLVELNASGCANRTNLPTARRVGRRRRAGLPQPREAAARDRRHRCCEIRSSKGAAGVSQIPASTDCCSRARRAGAPTNAIARLRLSERSHGGRIVSARRDGCSAPEAAESRARRAVTGVLLLRETSSELVDAGRSFVAHRPGRRALAAHLLRGRSCLCKPADDASDVAPLLLVQTSTDVGVGRRSRSHRLKQSRRGRRGQYRDSSRSRTTAGCSPIAWRSCSFEAGAL